jgi:two-component system, chemotaxis family, chemotaxis protein CheY
MATILIVDDAQFIRMRVAKVLTQHGHAVVEAGDGDQAVQVYRAAQPDAVVMDITMPVKDGIAALSEIRQFDPQARVIMLTALGQQSMILQAMRAGAKDYLLKPFNPEGLIQAIDKVLL